MEHILLPTTIQFEDTDVKNVGRLVITPCQQGYGTTIGNSLRRVLLSSLPGAAVETVKIDGVQHEFGAIDGVEEDMVEVILNLKQLALSLHTDGPVTLTLKKKGTGDVTAADFEKNADVEIANPDLKLMTISDGNKTLSMEVTVGTGRGYVPVAEKEARNHDLGTIVIDSLYTPVKDVGYAVSNTRVGDVTDYEKLTLTIETNGTVTPKDATKQATQFLMDHFSLVMEAASGNSIAPAPTADLEEADMSSEDMDDASDEE